jgi:hypothetical protein
VDQRDTNLKCFGLREGIYFIAVNVEWSEDTKDKVFHLSSYGAGKVQFNSNSTKIIENNCP